jgi:type 1 glutamine amidotransferase
MHLKILSLFAAVALTVGTFAADKKLVLIAGRPSHGPGEHEHRAGCLLLQKCLAKFPGLQTVVYENGWPTMQKEGKTVDNDAALADADAIVFYSDGEGKHPALAGDHLELIKTLVQRGVGIGCIHYAVEPADDRGQPEFLEWIGGAFEQNWSVNPVWQAEFPALPDHPVTRGVKPFSTKDEWYFHLRFRPSFEGITSILTAIPPASTMSRPDGTYSGNPAARAAVTRGDPQPVMWVVERVDGGRGFGFTGGHYHLGWKNDDQRKLVLNTMLWIAKVPVPEGGVQSTVTNQDMLANLDPKPAVAK